MTIDPGLPVALAVVLLLALLTIGASIALSLALAVVGGWDVTGPVESYGWLVVVVLLTTPVPEDASVKGFTARLKPRVPALVGVLPGVLLFFLWVGLRLGQPSEIAPGQPWKAWGPMFSPQNLA